MLCVHVPRIGSIVYSTYMYLRLVVLCVRTYMYLRLVVLCVYVPQVGSIVCTCTSGW